MRRSSGRNCTSLFQSCNFTNSCPVIKCSIIIFWRCINRIILYDLKFIPVFTSASMRRPFIFPLLVFTMITPLAPLEPYKALEDASSRKEILSISVPGILFRFPLYGIPSNTINGSLDALIDHIPRILMVGWEPAVRKILPVHRQPFRQFL